MNNEKSLVKEMTGFIQASPTPFHAVEQTANILNENGFVRLAEGDHWGLEPGKDYYVVRNQSSIIAFRIGEDLKDYRFQITASHSDSPCFKLKERGELTGKEGYTRLNTEGYGGMLCSSWMDRPLSMAGRVIVREGNRLESRLLNIDRDMVLIPNLAVHMNRQVNEGQSFNLQKDMLPLLSGSALEPGAVKRIAAKETGVNEKDIYGMDLFLYSRMDASVWGMDGEFVSSPRLDDLECAYTALRGFLEGSHPETVAVYACFDNEEVGSGTKQGAASTFLYDVLTRVNRSLGKEEEDFYRAVASSFLLSCDNAHALHPNWPEKSDEGNRVYMNRGVVVKSHAGQKYTSDGVSIAVFHALCEKEGIPVQYFANRSDMAGGSTLGNLAMSQVSMKAVDIGLAQLAMHSAYETAGTKDALWMQKAVKRFYQSCIKEDATGTLHIK